MPIKRPAITRPFVHGLAIVSTTAFMVAIAYVVLRPHTVVPPTIGAQLTFSPLVPKQAAAIHIQSDSIKYDKQDKVLSYVIDLPGAKYAVINEQATPQEFIDIPDAYAKVQSSLHPHLNFDSSHGVVSVGSVTNTDDDVALLRDRGVLIFVRINGGQLAEAQWRTLVDSLVLD